MVGAPAVEPPSVRSAPLSAHRSSLPECVCRSSVFECLPTLRVAHRNASGTGAGRILALMNRSTKGGSRAGLSSRRSDELVFAPRDGS